MAALQSSKRPPCTEYCSSACTEYCLLFNNASLQIELKQIILPPTDFIRIHPPPPPLTSPMLHLCDSVSITYKVTYQTNIIIALFHKLSRNENLV